MIEEYYPAFLFHLSELEKSLPQYVQDEFESYLKCGRLEQAGYLEREEGDGGLILEGFEDELMNAGATFAASCPVPQKKDSKDPLELIKSFSDLVAHGKNINVAAIETSLLHSHSVNYLYQAFYLSLAMKSSNAVQYALARAVLTQIREPDLFECGTTASFKLWAFSQRKQGKSFISLDLSEHGLTRIPPEQLIEIITAYDSDLEGLDLGENFLGLGMQYPQLLATIKALPRTLKYLGLQGTGLRYVPFEQLIELFHELPELRELDLRHNGFEFFIEPKQCLQLLQTLPVSLVKLFFDGTGFELSDRRQGAAAIIRKVDEINSRQTSVPSTSNGEDPAIAHLIRMSMLNKTLSQLSMEVKDRRYQLEKMLNKTNHQLNMNTEPTGSGFGNSHK